MDDDTKKQVQGMIDSAIKMHRHDGVLTQRILLQQIFGYAVSWTFNLALGETSVARITNGTTAVGMFESNANYFPFRVHAMYVISQDTTAATISLLNAGVAVATVAKGTVAGVMTGAVFSAPLNFNAGALCGIVSSSAGNAKVIIHLEFPDFINN